MDVKVFTNGCFDILHSGHVDLLTRAKQLGTHLIVGINSDRSVRAIKGAPRPFVSENERADVLRALKAVDEVVIFDETTPQQIIEKIKPDVLVKGGDWMPNQIIGADFVVKNGGKVISIPIKEGFSTSNLVEKINSDLNPQSRNETGNSSLEISLREHIDLFKALLRDDQSSSIIKCGEMIVNALIAGNKILLCGNGGSAGDAQHIAAELSGRFEKERRGLPAIALTTDSSALTAIGNDYGFERIYSRQIEALATKGDVAIGISTGGNSPNILAAMMVAREIGCHTIGLTGSKGKKLASLCDLAVLVPSERTARIQEAHITIGHSWCEMIDANF